MSRRVRMLLGLGAPLLWLAVSAESAQADERRPGALGSGRVVVAPVNLAVRAVAQVESGVEPVWRAMLGYFASEENPAIAIDRNDARALWNEVMEEAQGEGKGDELYAAYARFARRVGEQAEFASIIFPTIVTLSARVSGRVANWDGVHRYVDVPGQMFESIESLRHGRFWVTRYGATGELAAASLHVAVFSPRGDLRYDGRGGLVLLQEIIAPQKESGEPVEFVPVLRKDPFAAPDQLREGIEAAFRDWPSESASNTR